MILDSKISQKFTNRINPHPLIGKIKDPKLILKKWIWFYFILIIFEGALRKWILPNFATPLLIVRDPLAIWLLLMSVKYRLLANNIYVNLVGFIGIISIYTGVLIGHGNLIVAMYGARILLIHFPLIFVIGKVFSRDDVIKIGKVTLWLVIPMTILIIIQFYSPQSAFVNRGVGGDMAGAGFSGALDFMRPPGTFSFTTGVNLFFSFAACFIFFFWIDYKYINKLLLICATICLFIAIPFSISRTLLFQVGVTIFFTLIVLLKKPKHLKRMLLTGCILFFAYYFLGSTSFLQTSIGAFISRFTDAGAIEGGIKGTLGDRFLGGMLSAITESSNLPFWGYGSGMFTNAGAKMMTGKADFFNRIVEVEWGRILYEFGVFLGLSFIFIRIYFCFQLMIYCYKKMKFGDYMAWMLLSFGLLIILQGQWAQPNTLGFATLIGGLILASLKKTVGQ